MGRLLEGILTSLDSSLKLLKPQNVPTVFIGGGTPSLLPPELLRGFLEGLRGRIGSPSEFSIEVNPESLSRDFLQVLRQSDVNRISMGVQTYDRSLLEWLGRPAGPEAIFRADELLAGEWTGRVSRDLLAALPGGGTRLSGDAARALAGDPGHLSVYELTVESGTPLAESPESLLMLPDEDAAAAEWESVTALIGDSGYRRYEVSNFARPGEECRHNLGYWRMDPYLGVGPGAVSTLPSENAAALRKEECADLHRWLSDPAGSASVSEITVPELALEHFMMALRTSGGLSTERFREVFGVDPLCAAPRALERRVNEGLLEADDVSIRPTPRGMDFIDSVLADVAAESDSFRWPPGCLWPPP
jgi:oxygen-independent coproporphyrinogen-3 oxidase